MPEDKKDLSGDVIKELKNQLKAADSKLVRAEAELKAIKKDAVEFEDLTNNIKVGYDDKKVVIVINKLKPDKGENPEIVATAIADIGKKNRLQVKLYEPGRK